MSTSSNSVSSTKPPPRSTGLSSLRDARFVVQPEFRFDATTAPMLFRKVNLLLGLPWGTADGVTLSSCLTFSHAKQVWLAARFVVVGIGSVPNSELFGETLVLSKDGGIVTDSSLRTSHPSGDVFAAGDVACAPVPLMGNGEGDFMATAMRSQHVRAARDMGTFAARKMLAGSQMGEMYNPVPHMYSRSVRTSG